MKPVRVLLVDDHALFRAGLRALLARMPEATVVGEVGDARAALRLLESRRPDVVLMDIAMPGLDGLEAAAQIGKEFPAVKVIILSMHENREYVRRALQCGVCGYLLKDSTAAELEGALRAVTQGRSYFSAAISKAVIDDYVLRGMQVRGSFRGLTARQREILRLIAEGKTTKEIATLLRLSPKTVETHRTLLMRKLQIRDLAGLVRYAIGVGLVPPG